MSEYQKSNNCNSEPVYYCSVCLSLNIKHEDAIGSDSISTYYSSQYDEVVNNIPFSISVTPIAADGSVLSPEELDDYVYEQIDNATSLEDLMERDKIENGGKGLFIHS